MVTLWHSGGTLVAAGRARGLARGSPPDARPSCRGAVPGADEPGGDSVRGAAMSRASIPSPPCHKVPGNDPFQPSKAQCPPQPSSPSAQGASLRAEGGSRAARTSPLLVPQLRPCRVCHAVPRGPGRARPYQLSWPPLSPLWRGDGGVGGPGGTAAGVPCPSASPQERRCPAVPAQLSGER